MKIREAFLNMLYPRCCPVCHQVVKKKGELICDTCLEKLQPITQPRCMKCGKELTATEKEYCHDCTVRNHEFVQGAAIYPYGGTMQESIEKYKFQGRQEYGDFYVAAMAHYGGDYIRRWRPDCIIPVPITDKKKKLRGFNQSEYLAYGLGEQTGIMVDCHSLIRVEDGKAQKELTAAQRRHNLQNAFALDGQYPAYGRVLVVDDVYTTGSTIDAVAKKLKAAGTKNVYFLTICQGKGF